MKFFTSKTKKEIESLKSEIESLKRGLRLNTEIRIGNLPNDYFYTALHLGWQDTRPKISTNDAIKLILDKLDLSLKQTPSVPERTVLESKPKAKK